MRLNVTRRTLLQWLGALAAYPAATQEAPKGLTSDMSDPSALEYHVETPDLSIGLTSHGHIVELKLGAKKASVPFHACTFLNACEQEGPVTHQALDPGGVEFRRPFVHTGTRAQCTVIDRFIPTKSSIRWEVEVVGSGAPWSTPIETQLSWLNSSDASFWTAWGSPSASGSQHAQEDGLTKMIDERERIASIRNSEGWGNETKWVEDVWRDPLVSAPFADLNLRYGGFLNEHNAFSIPIATIMNRSDDLALSLVQSPESDTLAMRLKTSVLGDVKLVRTNHRISSSAPAKFSMDLVSHPADWRGGLGWMVDRYPNYFEPPNRSAYDIDGCGSYSGGEDDLDTDKLKKMAYSLNWNARFDWPFQGMSIPPVKSDVAWRSWYQKETSLAQMSGYDEKMEKSGFHVLEYFVTTEGGNYIADEPPVRKAKADSELWRDGNDFIHYQIPSAVVRERDGNIMYSNWFKNVVLDPAEPCWQKYLLEMAETLVKELPHSSGICIDRMDWLTVYNPHRDDGMSWVDGRPARSLLNSWKEAVGKLGAILHKANKFVYANTIITRIDCCGSLDGFYNEYGDFPCSLNLSALMAVHKPAIAWTRDINTLRPDADAFFQRHLHVGVFPTVPVPGADHTIPEDHWVDQCYLDYGPLLNAMRGKRWVLKPHVISVGNQAAQANLFKVPGGYVLPITFAGSLSEVSVTLRDAFETHERIASITALYPGEPKTSTVQYQGTGQEVRMTVPVRRGCALVKLACQPATGISSSHV